MALQAIHCFSNLLTFLPSTGRVVIEIVVLMLKVLLGVAVMGSTMKRTTAQKSSFHLLAFSTFILTTCAQQGPTYTATLSQARYDLTATAVGHLALFAGGRTLDGSVYSN